MSIKTAIRKREKKETKFIRKKPSEILPMGNKNPYYCPLRRKGRENR